LNGGYVVVETKIGDPLREVVETAVGRDVIG
jgi:hypothetical protein